MDKPYGGATYASSTDIKIYKYQLSVKSALESIRTISNVTVTMTAVINAATVTAACQASPGNSKFGTWWDTHTKTTLWI